MGCCDMSFLGCGSICDFPSSDWCLGSCRGFWILCWIKCLCIGHDILLDAWYVYRHLTKKKSFFSYDSFPPPLFLRNETTNSRRTRLCLRCPNIKTCILSSQDFPSLLDPALHLFPECRTRTVVQLWWSWIRNCVRERCWTLKKKKRKKKGGNGLFFLIYIYIPLLPSSLLFALSLLLYYSITPFLLNSLVVDVLGCTTSTAIHLLLL